MKNKQSSFWDLNPVILVMLGLSAIGFIAFIICAACAIEEGDKKRAEADMWWYYNIQSGADRYELNHRKGINSYTYSEKSTYGKNSYSDTGSSYSYSSNKSASSSSKTVDPMDHDIDTYYEDYKSSEGFVDEDDAWDDFEDNDDAWDDY